MKSNQVVKALNEKGYTSITDNDYEEWLEEYNHNFDEAVMDLLGSHAYNKYDILARLDAKLRFELGVGEKVVGGVDLSS